MRSGSKKIIATVVFALGLGGLSSGQILAQQTETVPNLPVEGSGAMQVPWGYPIVLGSLTHPTPAEHQVKEGENLHQLAAYYYGNARLWRMIYEANRGKLRSPNVLPVGMTLTIPAPQ